MSGAADDIDARAVARAVVGSNLLKAAVHGADPNWGRIAGAAGNGRTLYSVSGAPVAPATVARRSFAPSFGFGRQLDAVQRIAGQVAQAGRERFRHGVDAEDAEDIPSLKPVGISKGLFAARALGKSVLGKQGQQRPISGGFNMMSEEAFTFSPLKKDRRGASILK